jgi:hypothetical protein
MESKIISNPPAAQAPYRKEIKLKKEKKPAKDDVYGNFMYGLEDAKEETVKNWVVCQIGYNSNAPHRTLWIIYKWETGTLITGTRNNGKIRCKAFIGDGTPVIQEFKRSSK